jgi:hypothetical protein
MQLLCEGVSAVAADTNVPECGAMSLGGFRTTAMSLFSTLGFRDEDTDVLRNVGHY